MYSVFARRRLDFYFLRSQSDSGEHDYPECSGHGGKYQPSPAAAYCYSTYIYHQYTPAFLSLNIGLSVIGGPLVNEWWRGKAFIFCIQINFLKFQGWPGPGQAPADHVKLIADEPFLTCVDTNISGRVEVFSKFCDADPIKRVASTGCK